MNRKEFLKLAGLTGAGALCLQQHFTHEERYFAAALSRAPLLHPLELSDAAKDLIAERGFDPSFGARPLRRAIRDLVENPLAKLLLAGDFSEGDVISGDLRDGKLVFLKK